MDDAFLSFKPTEKLAEVDHSFKKLDREINQFESNPIFNISRARKLVNKAKDLHERARNLKGKGFESAVLTNIAARARAIHYYMKVRLKGNYDYMTILRNVYGVKEKDIEDFRKEVSSTGIQNLSKIFLDPEFNVRNTSPNSINEIKEVRNFFERACRDIFREAPDRLTEQFKGLEDYMETINMSKSGGKSHHKSGNVVLSLKNAPVARVQDGDEVDRYVNVVKGMKIVGEETLLGHQGQYIFTTCYNLPYSLMPSRRHTMLASEIVGKFGRSQSLSLLKENQNSFTEFLSKDLLNYLYGNSEEEERAKYLYTKFVKLISDYLYMVEDKNIEEIQEFLEDITGWEYYTSQFFRKKLEKRYSSTLWDSYWSNIKEWIYIVAYKRHKEIERKLDRIDENKAKKIRNYLRVGEWTRKGFEAYLDFLLEYLD